MRSLFPRGATWPSWEAAQCSGPRSSGSASIPRRQRGLVLPRYASWALGSKKRANKYESMSATTRMQKRSWFLWDDSRAQRWWGTLMEVCVSCTVQKSLKNLWPQNRDGHKEPWQPWFEADIFDTFECKHNKLFNSESNFGNWIASDSGPISTRILQAFHKGLGSPRWDSKGSVAEREKLLIPLSFLFFSFSPFLYTHVPFWTITSQNCIFMKITPPSPPAPMEQKSWSSNPTFPPSTILVPLSKESSAKECQQKV